jgi:ABC-2 type transport system ATP-binding protein
MKEKVIEVEGLVKKYGKVTAVAGISFKVHQGEIFSLVGPNGAGKTTTVEILECLRLPTAGVARVLGYDVVADAQEIKKRIGVLPQDFSTFELLTVKENIELARDLHRSKSSVENLLRELGLWEVRNRKFGELSGGMKQRVGVAMAFISEPEILFLDEPTTGLDPQARRELWEVIKKLKSKGVTVFLTTHYMEEVESLADRAGIIVEGRLFAVGEVRELIFRYGGEVKVRVEGEKKARTILQKFAKDIIEENGAVVGIFPSREKVARALANLYRLGGLRIRIMEPGMEDVFLRVVGGRVNERGELVK